MAAYVPIKIAYNTYEAASGTDKSLTPVLFLHGVTATKEHWGDIPQLIANGTKRKIYALDFRNHGDSEYTEVFHFDMDIDDVFHFMDTVCAPKAVIVGASMGGSTAIRAALRKPERVEILFVEDMFAKKIPQELLSGEKLKDWIALIHSVPPGLSESEALKFAVNELASKMPPESNFKPKLEHFRLRLIQQPDGRYDVSFNKKVLINALSNSAKYMSDPSGQYDGPAYFLYGGISEFKVGEEEDDIKKYFPNAELIEFKEASHQVHVDNQDKFVETILKYLL